MIPSSSFESMYFRIIGENSLLSMAQSHLLCNLERIAKIRTYTFITNNGQTEFGISRNFGHERYYSWEDTIIDCRNCPSLVDNESLQDFTETISENYRFHRFKTDIEERSGGLITVEPFNSVLRGEDNMRYNIRRSSKVEDFDIIRVGVLLSASSDAIFKKGLDNLKYWESPLKNKKPLQHA